jgi:hypothetical protein
MSYSASQLYTIADPFIVDGSASDIARPHIDLCGMNNNQSKTSNLLCLMQEKGHLFRALISKAAALDFDHTDCLLHLTSPLSLLIPYNA